MKKIVTAFFLLSSIICHLSSLAQPITGVRISDMPTYTGNASDGYVPIVINGANRKIMVSNMQAGKVDSIRVRNDSLFSYATGIAFYSGKIPPTKAYDGIQQLDSATYIIRRNDGIVDTITFSGSSPTAVPTYTFSSEFNNSSNSISINSIAAAKINYSIVTSAATSLPLSVSVDDYYFNGSSAATWTLPAVSNIGKKYTISNIGSATLTLTGTLFSNTTIGSIKLLTGDSYELQSNGAYWKLK